MRKGVRSLKKKKKQGREIRRATRRAKREGCDAGKSTVHRHRGSKTDPSTLKPLEMVVVDRCGELAEGVHGQKYMMTVVDVATRYTEVRLLTNKK